MIQPRGEFLCPAGWRLRHRLADDGVGLGLTLTGLDDVMDVFQDLRLIRRRSMMEGHLMAMAFGFAKGKGSLDVLHVLGGAARPDSPARHTARDGMGSGRGVEGRQRQRLDRVPFTAGHSRPIGPPVRRRARCSRSMSMRRGQRLWTRG